MQVGALIIDCIIQLAGWLISSALKTDKIYDLLGKHQAARRLLQCSVLEAK